MSPCNKRLTIASIIEKAASAYGEIKNLDERRERKTIIENDISEMCASLRKRALLDSLMTTQRTKTGNKKNVIVGTEAEDENDAGKMDNFVAIHLFRKALRLHDNEGLTEAAKSCSMLIPLYIFRTNEVDPEFVGVNRIDIILQSLRDLDDSLRKIGSRLYVAIGDPVDIIRSIINHYTVCKVTYERDHNPDQQKRNNMIAEMARERGKIDVSSYSSYTLFNVDRILPFLTDGKALLSMEEFSKVLAHIGNPEKPISVPNSVPPPPNDLENLIPEVLHTVPSMTELTKEYGYSKEENKAPFLGGEKEALRRLEEVLEKQDVGQQSSSGLSPYLALGSLSVRLVHARLKEKLAQRGDASSTSDPAVLLKYQLLRREHAYVVAYLTPEFNHREDNPLCLCMDIPWCLDDRADVLLRKWEMGQTGYPAVDAVMNQLRCEGWINSKCRELVLSFLTRGGLFLFWKMGMDLMETYFIDYDWAINSYSWHNLCCTNFYFQNYDVHDPVTFFNDPKGEYIRKYIPALQSFPNEYIFEPWKAPNDVQAQADCVIGIDYPKPIVDHDMSSKANRKIIKDVVNRYFDSA